MSMFSRRHYQFLAEIIGKSTSLINFQQRLEVALTEDNTGFDPLRFEKAIAKAGAMPRDRRDAVELFLSEGVWK